MEQQKNRRAKIGLCPKCLAKIRKSDAEYRKDLRKKVKVGQEIKTN